VLKIELNTNQSINQSNFDSLFFIIVTFESIQKMSYVFLMEMRLDGTQIPKFSIP